MMGWLTHENANACIIAELRVTAGVRDPVDAPIARGVVDGDLVQWSLIEGIVDEAEADAFDVVGFEVGGEDGLFEL